MAGYSQTPLVRKLGIKSGHRVTLVNPPDDLMDTLGDIPEGVRLFTNLRSTKPSDVLIAFFSNMASLEKKATQLKKRLQVDGGLWIAWPKKSSGLPTDLSDGDVRRIGLNAGLVDNKVCAIDDVWSGLRFVYRIKDRPKTR